MALVYAATEVIFPAWVISGPGQARLGWALVLGALGYALGFQIWSQWAWRRPRTMLLLSLILQSLVLMGAGLVVFQNWLLLWYGGLLVFSLAVPVALSAMHSLWQQQGSAEQLSQLLAQRYRLEWGARLMAFAGSAALVDGVLRPALAWPHWPDWLISGLGQGPGRPLAVGLGALGWLLLLSLLSQEKGRLRSSPSDA
jgi:hypothetical protein